MCKLLLTISVLASVGVLSGCHSVTTTATTMAAHQSSRPMDNLGGVLKK